MRACLEWCSSSHTRSTPSCLLHLITTHQFHSWNAKVTIYTLPWLLGHALCCGLLAQISSTAELSFRNSSQIMPCCSNPSGLPCQPRQSPCNIPFLDLKEGLPHHSPFWVHSNVFTVYIVTFSKKTLLMFCLKENFPFALSVFRCLRLPLARAEAGSQESSPIHRHSTTWANTAVLPGMYMQEGGAQTCTQSSNPLFSQEMWPSELAS